MHLKSGYLSSIYLPAMQICLIGFFFSVTCNFYGSENKCPIKEVLIKHLLQFNIKLSINAYCKPHTGHCECRTRYISGHGLLQNVPNMIEESDENIGKYNEAVQNSCR